MRTGKTILAVLSVVVLTVTGLVWSQLASLQNGLTTANVIDSGGPGYVAAEQNILMVGLDTRVDAQGNPLPADLLNLLHAGSAGDGGNNTDTMIVIHIPAGGGSATAFSIPRDSYVQISGGYGKHKINSAYTYAQVAAINTLSQQGVTGPKLAVQAAQEGAKNAIQTVQQLTGLTFTHFASVNLVGFYNISQAVGGVPVCLKAATQDSFSGANFPAGPQTISGAQALAFVRQRHGLPMGDLDRVKRQQVFMASLAKTVLSGGTLTNPAKLTALIDAVKKTVTLDQGWDVLSFAQHMQGMSSGKITFHTIPVGTSALETPSDGVAVEVFPQQVKDTIAATINAAAPKPDSPTTAGAPAAPAPPAPPNSSVTVDVRNASGITGLAGKAQQHLVDLGFGVTPVSNSTSRSKSVLDYATGDQVMAQKVAAALGGISIAPDSSLSAGKMRVYLGSDFDINAVGSSAAPTSAPAAPPPAPTPPITAGAQNCIN
jgi:LCP family protein required for cell wall assembly